MAVLHALEGAFNLGQFNLGLAIDLFDDFVILGLHRLLLEVGAVRLLAPIEVFGRAPDDLFEPLLFGNQLLLQGFNLAGLHNQYSGLAG